MSIAIRLAAGVAEEQNHPRSGRREAQRYPSWVWLGSIQSLNDATGHGAWLR